MATTADTPGLFPVALNGVGFMLDDSDGNPGVVHQSIRTQREQSVGEGNIGESTVNPEGFWRRSRDGWHHGAGQSYGDRDTSDPLRFRDSRKIDVFSNRHQISLCKAMTAAHTLTGSTTQNLLSVAGRVYFLDDTGGNAKFTDDPLTLPWTPTTVTGLPATVTSVCAIGSTVFIGTSSGVYSTTTTTTPATSYATGGAVAVWEAKGRLMVSGSAGTFYNVTAAGALPAPLITFPAGLGVVGVTGQKNWIYVAVAGASAPSKVYKTTIQPDGTALTVPTLAGELPGGEVFAASTRDAIFGANGSVFVHTNRGVRMGEIDSDGNIIFGSVIPSDFLNGAAFTSEGRFVWYASSRSGVNSVGKADMSVTTLPVTPAYASDMEPPNNGFVNGLATYNGRRVVSTSTVIYVEAESTYATTGHVDSGLLALDLADSKTAVAVDVEGGGLDATETIVEALSVDRGATFTTVGTWDSQADGEAAVTGIAASRQFEMRTTLNGDGTATPTLYRHTLKAEPGVSQGLYIIARLRVFENELGYGNQRTSRASVSTTRAAVEALQASREVVVWQEGSTNYNVTVRDLEWQSALHAEAPADGELNGVMQVRMKVISNA